VKKRIAGILREFAQYIPLGWVLTCYDLGIDWMVYRTLEGLVTVVISTFFAGILHTVGTACTSNLDHSADDEPVPIARLLFRVAGMIVACAVITSLVVGIDGHPLP
jgi:hypothetical protein